MAKTAKSFVIKYQGRALDYDRAYGVQCVDGARYWMDYFLGSSIPCAGGWANGYWLSNKSWFTSKGCTLITSPSALRNGDLVIWNKGSKSHPSSHVAMYYNGMEFGQNQGGNRGFCLKATNFGDMLGAFRAPTCAQESSSSNGKEAVDQILHVGSHVTFPSKMKVTKVDTVKNWVYIPVIGGWIGAKPCDEVSASDGKNDQIVHADSEVTIKGKFTVTDVNIKLNKVKLKAYSGCTGDWEFNFWINAKPLTEVA